MCVCVGGGMYVGVAVGGREKLVFNFFSLMVVSEVRRKQILLRIPNLST